ncbi:glutathione S-transferase family protein [Methylovulum miyakonense]|uniref:glutathione S-transferase family protein n=1 Tax=Methylovulum miyakonense TaxID=645578 RepID=UPI00037A294F|nr:glutathione S-transferase [Methylovulum miyakonense]
MIKLYEFAVSGNAHKVRLMLSLLGLAYEGIAVDGLNKQHKTAEFLAMNPFGQVPVLIDGEFTLRDSNAILVYLARQYGDAHWLPNEPKALAQVMAWLATSANELAWGPSRLRVHYKFGREINVEESEQITANLLAILERQLTHNDWLALDHITIADIAIYPYIALAPEANIDLTDYPTIIAWLRRIQALPNYVGMAGMWEV